MNKLRIFGETFAQDIGLAKVRVALTMNA